MLIDDELNFLIRANSRFATCESELDQFFSDSSSRTAEEAEMHGFGPKSLFKIKKLTKPEKSFKKRPLPKRAKRAKSRPSSRKLILKESLWTKPKSFYLYGRQAKEATS